MIALPTLAQLFSRNISNLETEYGITISLSQKVALRAIAAVMAGCQWLQYKVVGFTQKNIWPDTADPESKGGTLERFGRVRLNRNPFPAVAGQYTCTVTGTTGAILPAQTTVFKSDDSSLHPGILFVLDSQYILPSSSGSILLRCLTPGIEGKLSIGDTLTVTSPIPLVNSQVTVTAESIQPLAGETIEEYRQNILNSFRIEAQGGAGGDYRIWAGDAQGVQKVYPYAKSNAVSEIDLYVEATIADSTDGKGTPSAQTLTDVQTVVNFNPDTSLPLNERGRRPITDIVNYLPVTPYNVNVTITGGNFSAAQKTAINAALTTAINAVRPYVPSADTPQSENKIIDTNKINGVIYSAVPGAVYTGITLNINGSNVLTYTFILGFIPYPNTFTYN